MYTVLLILTLFLYWSTRIHFLQDYYLNGANKLKPKSENCDISTKFFNKIGKKCTWIFRVHILLNRERLLSRIIFQALEWHRCIIYKTMNCKFLIIGGGIAGVTCAEQVLQTKFCKKKINYVIRWTLWETLELWMIKNNRIVNGYTPLL